MIKIHKEVYGQGKTIVLIHGWAMHSGVWRAFAQALAKNHQVICLDIPGHGLSDTVEPYKLEQISEVLMAEIAEPTFCLLGWSLGASIALSMTTRYPQRINSLILVAGNPKFVETENWHGMPVQLLEDFAENLQESCQLTLLRFLALQVNGLSDGKALLKQLRQAIYECDAPAENVLKKGLKILKQADLREDVRQLQCPLMLVLGDKDSLIPVQVAEDIQKIQANSVLNIIKGAGHVPFLSHPSVLLKMIRDFLLSAVFSMPKNKIRQSFASAADSYDGFAVLQRQVGLDLISMFDISTVGQRAMDLGCGTGFLIQELMAAGDAQKMLAVDIAYSMLQVSRRKLKYFNAVQYICADAEKLPLVDHSLDAIVSNLALQWCQDLMAVSKEFKRVLKTDGRLIFSTFGTKTLQELKHSWAEVDSYSHVNDFSTADQLKVCLTQSSFKDIQIEQRCYTLNYPSVLALMKELKGIGASHVMSGRNKKITPRLQMQAMIHSYEHYRGNGLIPATYEVLFVSASV